MLYTRKKDQAYTALAEQVISYAEKSGYQDIRADFEGYESPAPLTMVDKEVTLTPDFTAKRDENKYYFELVVKNGEQSDKRKLVSKWKALALIAKMKGGRLRLFVPYGSYKFAADLVNTHGIDAQLTKMTDL